MGRRTGRPKRLLDKLAEIGEKDLSKSQQVQIAKKTYLIRNEEDIKMAEVMGYPHSFIAKIATTELLKNDIPRDFTEKTKEGEEKLIETKFTRIEIKRFCNPEDA